MGFLEELEKRKEEDAKMEIVEIGFGGAANSNFEISNVGGLEISLLVFFKCFYFRVLDDRKKERRRSMWGRDQRVTDYHR